MIKEHVDNAAVISNIGQLRNFSVVCNQFGIKRPRVFILYNNDSLLLRDALILASQEYGFYCEALCLPRRSNLMSPWKVHGISKLYRGIYRRCIIKNLWICNTNNYYSYLAWFFYKKGSRINYFEEGLGTYLSADDPTFAYPGMLVHLRQVLKDLRALKFRRLTRKQKLLRIGSRFTVIFVRSPVGSFLNNALTFGRVRHFRKHWTGFDRAVVRYPDKIDLRLICAKELLQLQDIVAGYIGDTSLLPSGCNRIFLHQPYDFDDDIWIDSIAKALIFQKNTLGWSNEDTIMIKFHPRDHDLFKASFVEGLAARGLRVLWNSEMDRVPAENILSDPNLKLVIGLTSSSLIYGRDISRKSRVPVCYVTIVDEVIHHISDSFPFHDAAVRQLESHANVFKKLWVS